MPRRSTASAGRGRWRASTRCLTRSGLLRDRVRGLTAADALARTGSLVAEARQSSLFAAKDEAMRELLRTAGWQWAGAMLLGLVFVIASRRPSSSALGVALALATWAAAAYAARVPWPLAGEQSFVPARDSLALPGSPAPFVLGLLALAASVL